LNVLRTIPSAARPRSRARSIFVRSFPFDVVYRPSPDELLVIAIAPHRKRPHYWASRIE